MPTYDELFTMVADLVFNAAWGDAECPWCGGQSRFGGVFPEGHYAESCEFVKAHTMVVDEEATARLHETAS